MKVKGRCCGGQRHQTASKDKKPAKEEKHAKIEAEEPKEKAPKLKEKKPKELPVRKGKKHVSRKTKKEEEPPQPKFDKFEQVKREGNMERDQAKYALVHFEESESQVKFVLVNIFDGKLLNIGIKNKEKVSCSCMDWRMRCAKNNLVCKHIVYIMKKILQQPSIDLVVGNKVHNFEALQKTFQRVQITFGSSGASKFIVSEERALTAEDLCPICFTEMHLNPKDELIACNVCKGIVHKDCMACWLKNAVKKSCVYCRNPQMNFVL